MELPRMAASLLGIGFDGLSPPAQTQALLEQGVGGVILFKRNVESPEQFEQLTRSLKSTRPLFVAIDHEGGRVQRLRDPFTLIPSMRLVGQTRNSRLAFEIGQMVARELRAVHVDWNFAPVLDVDSNPGNPVIGDRSFGPSAEVVSMMGCSYLTGLQSEGVAACGKHFPGHGDTSEDSHLHLPRLTRGLTRLREVELPPFEHAIRAGVASIMTAHVIFQALDPNYPATLSRPSLDGILRDRMRFDGVVVSDDLEMKAIADHFGLEEAIVRGLNAGVDLFLVCHSPPVQRQAIEIIVSSVEKGHVPAQRFEQACARVRKFGERFVQPPSQTSWKQIVGCDAHQRLVERVKTHPSSMADPTETWRT